MVITTYQLGTLQTNCYLLIEDNNCLIIDPADEAGFILEELQRKKLNPIALLATHGHFDHIGAVGEIQLFYDIPFYVFKEDQFLIDRLNETAEHFLGFNPHFLKPKTIKYLKKGNFSITPACRQGKDYELRIIKTTGHTPGGCSFYIAKDEILFSGDTLFKQGIGRYDFSYCSRNDLKNSVEKLLKLPKNTKVYPGHGEKTIIGDEQTSLQLIV